MPVYVFPRDAYFVNPGDIAYARCDFRAAQADHQRSLTHYLERDLSEISSVAYSQLSLGEAAAALYNVATSMTWLDAALKIFEKTESVHGILHCRMVLGDLAFYLGPGHFGEVSFHAPAKITRSL